jgi:hypothetical protein
MSLKSPMCDMGAAIMTETRTTYKQGANVAMCRTTQHDAAREAAKKAAVVALTKHRPLMEYEMRQEVAGHVADALMDLRATRGLGWLRGMRAHHRQIQVIRGNQSLTTFQLDVSLPVYDHVLRCAADAIVATLGRTRTEGNAR